MDREISRDTFLCQLKRNVAALKEAPSLGNPRVGLSEWSEGQLTLIKEYREEVRAAQYAAQLQADLQRSRTEYSDVFRANPIPVGLGFDSAAKQDLTTQPRSDVDARRHVTSPLLGLFYILMRRQRVAHRLACLDGHRAQQRKLERAAISTSTETEVPCAIAGHGPYVLLPPSDVLGERAAPTTNFDVTPNTVDDMPNQHFVSLRPPQPLRKPLVFQQAHYRLEPFPEFCIDVRGESERELDAYRSHHRTTPGVPALQHFSQPPVTMETFAPTSTCHFGPANVYGTSEYRPHHISKASTHETGDTARTRTPARTQADLYLAPSAVTLDTNLRALPQKLSAPCAEDSMSEDDEDFVAQQCSFKANPTWLPTPSEHACGTFADPSIGHLAPPPTFVSFLDKFA